MVVFGQTCGIRVGWLYSGKMDVMGQSGCNPGKCLYSDKVVAFWENCCIRANWLCLCKSV